MDEGPSIHAQLTDCRDEQFRVGLPLRIELWKISEEGEAGIIINYGYKAVPA